MAQGDKPPSFGDFDERMKRLRGAPEEAPVQQTEAEPPSMRLSDGFQAGVEVIAGVGGGALLGYGLDYWFGTAPLLLIACFVLGAAAGVLNAYRTLRRFMGEAEGSVTVGASPAGRAPRQRPDGRSGDRDPDECPDE